MSPSDATWRHALEEFVVELRSEFGNRLSQVILFGSRSRGDAREGSDIDVLVVLLNASDYWADFDRVTRAAARTSLRHDLLLSAIPVTEDRLATSGSPFIRNVRREGVRVA